ncbi:transcription initiation factor IIB [Coemansia sp. S2]|nr:transcription initiation factor IIB [Coemansia sp. S2]
MTKADDQKPFDRNEPEFRWSAALKCPHCRDKVPNLVEDFASGDYICGDCGLVLDCIIDTRPEWRTFTNDERGDDPSRVGNAANPFLVGTHLDTVIVQRDGRSYELARDLNHTQNSNRTHGRTLAQRHDHNLVQAYKEITTLCESYDMPRSTIAITKQLYKRAEKENLLQGKNNKAIIGVCIFIARRRDNASLTFKDICALTKVNRKEIARTFKFLKSKWDMDTGTTSSNDLITRFCANLNLDQDTRRIADILAQRAKDMDNISGKNPVSIASACIYLSSHLLGCGCNPKAISDIAGVNETTIRATYKILHANCKGLLTPDIFASTPKANEDNLPIPSPPKGGRPKGGTLQQG